MTDEEVYQSTRFPRPAVLELCDMLTHQLQHPTGRSNALSVDTQILVALQFFATGTFQWMVWSASGVTQSSVCRAIDRVSKALCDIVGNFIMVPTEQSELLKIKVAFSDVVGFPNVVGAIDCTHIPLVAPKHNEDSYVNRKGGHSINVQAVCDAHMKIIDLVVKWLSSTHDAFVWGQCSLRQLFEGGLLQDCWLVGLWFINCKIMILSIYYFN